MKRLIAALLFTGVVAAAGCNPGGTAGGPAATTPGAKPPIIGQADDTFNLTTSSISVQQGEAAQGVIGIKRGANFTQDVAITLDGLPKGVTIDPASPALTSASTDAKFTLTAGDDASLGEFTVKVVGKPTKGGDATNQFKLTVAKRDSFTLGMPFWTTGLKQGETRVVAIEIKREKKFDQDVTIKFDALPKGISIEPAGAVVKHGEADSKFAVKAADDAAPGEYAVKVTGHPTKGLDVMQEFKFTVAKK